MEWIQTWPQAFAVAAIAAAAAFAVWAVFSTLPKL
jgi:hypothetical protein